LLAYPDPSDRELQLFSYERGLQKEKLWRSLQRNRRAHQAAYASYQKLYA